MARQAGQSRRPHTAMWQQSPGAAVVGVEVVGTEVVGPPVVGPAVVGTEVVGPTVVGTEVVGPMVGAGVGAAVGFGVGASVTATQHSLSSAHNAVDTPPNVVQENAPVWPASTWTETPRQPRVANCVHRAAHSCVVAT